ncbi:peptidase S8 [Listeria grandensis]|uniref:S8 family serine peptidase n=1 Tax=Listeria grandensis TaxID=1494963 RepID=UPI00162973F5|nr:S8 family serine peptidase [Listeria grandensis]MBC1474032.1 peptidase S8 [Listeria grandensis]
MKKILITFTVLFLVCLPLSHVKAVTKTDPSATLLKAEETTHATFPAEESEAWYKIVAPTSNDSGHTHFKVTLKSKQILSLSIYPSKERALADDTFFNYRVGTGKNNTATVNFPDAWDGEYWLKVSYIPKDDPSTVVAPYSLQYEEVFISPDHPAEKGAKGAVETAVMNKEDAADTLKDVRSILDGLLASSDAGKEISKLYYKTSPFLVEEFLQNSSSRNAFYNNLKVLRPFIQAAAEKREYTISKEEAKAFHAVSALIKDAVPTSLAKDIAALENKIDSQNLAGSSLSSIFDSLNVSATFAKSGTSKFIVKMKPNTSPKNLIKKASEYSMKTTTLDDSPSVIMDDFYTIHQQISDNSIKSFSKLEADTRKQALDSLPEVEYVEKVTTYSKSSGSYDAYQWAINKNSVLKDAANVDIQYDDFWKSTASQKLAPVKVAVVDSGVDSRLKELQGRVDISNAKSFVEPNGDGSYLDDNGHGTHVAGIIGANSENNLGMKGIANNATILPIKVLDSDTNGDTDEIARGIQYAVDQKVDVINLSLVGEYSPTLEYVLKNAEAKGITVVAATGNDGENNLLYPANSKYTIAVGATNSFGIMASYSNYGRELDVVAPGSKIASTIPDGNIAYMGGTSMATPHVAALVGLLKGQNKALKPAEIRQILRTTTNPLEFSSTEQENNSKEGMPFYEYGESISPAPLSAFFNIQAGYGKINIWHALSKNIIKAQPATLFDNTNYATGKALANTEVKVFQGTKKIGEGKATATGQYKVWVPLQKSGAPLTLTFKNGTNETKARMIVARGAIPAAPKVTTFTDKDTLIKGQTVESARVVVKNSKNQIVASGNATPTGSFGLKIAKQPANSKLNIQITDLAKRTSKATTITVKDVTPPKAPTVNTIKSTSTTITGTGEKGATVRVYFQTKLLGSAKVDAKGKYSVKIAKQKSGTSLSIKQFDAANNVSPVVNKKVVK